jgi:Family of unknown function (DUF6529)
MEDLVERLARGNVSEVKVMLASIALALAVYQLVLIAVCYGKLRVPFLASRPAGLAHRASGDAIAAIMVVVAVMCLSYFGFEDDATVHVVAATALLVVLALKVAVLRVFHGASRFLPLLGTSVFVLLAITWVTSAGMYFADN